MSGCLEVDSLVTLGNLLEWKTNEALEHLLSCEECQAQLDQLAAVHTALDDTIEPAARFADRVMVAVRADEEERAAKRWVPGLVDILNPLFAGATAFVALLLVAGVGAPLRPGAPLLIASALAAAATILWNAIDPLREPHRF